MGVCVGGGSVLWGLSWGGFWGLPAAGTRWCLFGRRLAFRALPGAGLWRAARYGPAVCCVGAGGGRWVARACPVRDGWLMGCAGLGDQAARCRHEAWGYLQALAATLGIFVQDMCRWGGDISSDTVWDAVDRTPQFWAGEGR